MINPKPKKTKKRKTKDLATSPEVRVVVETLFFFFVFFFFFWFWINHWLILINLSGKWDRPEMTRALGCQTHAFCEEACQSLARKACCECGFHHSGLPQKVKRSKSTAHNRPFRYKSQRLWVYEGATVTCTGWRHLELMRLHRPVLSTGRVPQEDRLGKEPQAHAHSLHGSLLLFVEGMWWSPCARWYKDANLVLFQCAYQDTTFCCVHPNCVDAIDNHVCENCRPDFICNIKTCKQTADVQVFWLSTVQF